MLTFWLPGDSFALHDMAQPKPEYPGKLLQAAAIAKPFQDSIQTEISERKEKQLSIPKLVGILAKPSPPPLLTQNGQPRHARLSASILKSGRLGTTLRM